MNITNNKIKLMYFKSERIKDYPSALKSLLVFMFLFFSGITFSAINILVDASPKNPAPGELVMTRIIVTNTSVATTGNVRVELPFPDDLFALPDNALSQGGDCTNISGSDSFCNSGDTVFWTVGALTAHQSVTLFIAPFISNTVADGTVVSFNGQVFESNVLQASSSQTVEILSAKVLNLAVNPNKHPVAPNDQLTYTLTYGHQGSITTTGTEVRFPLPADVSFVAADNGGSMSGNDVVWNIGSLTPGKGGQLNVNVQLDTSAVKGVILTGANATISGTANFINEQAEANTATWVGTVPEINFSMVPNLNTAVTGEFLPTQLIVSNPTNTTKTGVRVEFFFTSGLQNFDKDGLLDGGQCLSSFGSSFSCDSGETIFWDVGTLNPNSSKVYLIQPNLVDSIAGNLVSFVARAFADNNSVIWQSETVLVQSSRALNLAVETKNNPVLPDSDIIYDLTYGNQGPTATTDTQLEFTIPDGTSFVSASDGVLPVGDKLTWDVGLLNPEEGGKHQVTLQLDSGLVSGDLVAVENVVISGTANFQKEQTFADDVAAVGDVAELGFSMQVNPNPAVTGEFLPTQFTITNRTNILQTGLKIQFFYAGGLLDFSEGGLLNSGDCASVFGSSFDCNSGETVVWEIGNLGPNISKSIFIAPNVSSTVAGDLILFLAKASADESNDRWVSETIRVQSEKTLILAVDANNYNVSASDKITYDVTFGHQGIAATTNTTLTFNLPAHTTLVSASGAYTLDGDDLIWDLGTLNAGDGGKRQVVVQVNPSVTAGDIVDLEFVTLFGEGVNLLESAEANTSVWVGDVAQLDFSMAVNPNPANPGEFLPTQLTISNTSDVVQTGIRAELFFAQGLFALRENSGLDGINCVSLYGSSFDCDGGEIVVWAVGTLPPYGAKTITIAPLLASTTASGDMIRLNARAFANGTSDRWQQITALVKDDLSLNLAVDSVLQPVIPEQYLSYDLTFGNRGTSPATNTQLSMPIPEGSSFFSADANGVSDGSHVVWDIGTVNPGEGSRRQATFQLDNTVMIGEIIEAYPGIKADDDKQAWTKSSQRIRFSDDLTLLLDLTPQTLLQDDVFDADLTVENYSVGTMTDIGLDMYYPNFLTSYNDSLLTDNGDCLSLWGSGSRCDSGETVFWSLGSIFTNENRMLNISPTIDNNTNPAPSGTVIQFFGRASNAALDEAFTSRSLLVGNFVNPPQSEIDVFGNGNEIANGSTATTADNNTFFGSIPINAGSISNTYAIINNGSGVLNLTGNPRVQITGVNEPDFNVTLQPSASVAIGGSTIFEISFNPTSTGIKNATVVISSDDQYESPYTFSISGTGLTSDLIFADDFED